MGKKKEQRKTPQKKDAGLSFLLLPLLLAVLTFVLYSPARQNGFTNWDDKEYVTENPNITSLNIKEEFKREHMGNYHPLAMISLNLDYSLNKFDPKTFHTTSILLHILASVMAFFFVQLLIGNSATAFIAALLFAIHPMHVESVAWISERKDVLYGLFLISALFFYARYVLSGLRMQWLVFAIVCFLLSCFSKGQAVVFPVLCLLIDYYKGRPIKRRAIIEKIPLFAISLVFGFAAIHAQQKFQAIQSADLYPYFDRILFSGFGLFTYLWKLVFPLNLTAFYPYPLKINGAYPAEFYIAPLVSLAIIFIVWKFFRKNEIVVFGSLFFLFSLALVLQILPVGGAVVAERYTYVPYLGLFIVIGYYLTPQVIRDSSAPRKANKFVPLAIASAFIIFCSFLTYKRIGVWKDSVTLWKDAEQKSKISPKIYSNFGDAYLAVKDYDKAVFYLNEAIRLKNDYDEALYNRGLAFFFQKKYKEAIDDYTLAIKYNPKLARAWFNRSGTYYTLGQYQLALDDALNARALGYTVDDKYIEALKQNLKNDP